MMFCFGFVKSQEIGMVTQNDGWLKVEDIDGNSLYNGSGSSGKLMGFSSKIIVTQNYNDTHVYKINRYGSLESIYSGNSVNGKVVNVAGMSVFTKTKGGDNCKYTISSGGRLENDYCRNY